MMCIRSAVLCSTHKKKISLSFRGRALMRETGLAWCTRTNAGCWHHVHIGHGKQVWVQEPFLCRPAPSSSINSALPASLPACLS